jgi:hypothetical protein
MHRDNINIGIAPHLKTCFDYRRHRGARVGTSPDAVAQGDNPANCCEHKFAAWITERP